MTNTGIDDNGSVLQYAVLRSPDFIRPLLEHGYEQPHTTLKWPLPAGFESWIFEHIHKNVVYRVDPLVGSDTKDETPFEIAANRGNDWRYLNLLALMNKFVEFPTRYKIRYVQLLVKRDELIQSDEDLTDILQKQLQSLSDVGIEEVI